MQCACKDVLIGNPPLPPHLGQLLAGRILINGRLAGYDGEQLRQGGGAGRALPDQQPSSAATTILPGLHRQGRTCSADTMPTEKCFR